MERDTIQDKVFRGKKRKRGKKKSVKTMDVSVVTSLKESDKGSYYNQQFSESDRSETSKSLEDLQSASVSFAKLNSFIVAPLDEDHNENDDSDDDMIENWMMTSSNIETTSDSDSEGPIMYDDEPSSSNSGRVLIHTGLLKQCIQQSTVCSKCLVGKLDLYQTYDKNKKGLCVNLTLNCIECGNATQFDSDERGTEQYNKMHTVNRLSVLAMRMIGKSRNALLKFCSIMDLPSPVNYGPFKNHIESWKTICSEAVESNMTEAVEELKDVKRTSGWDGEGICKCAVSVDGSWAHVGYSSRFGFVSVISIDTGKVLDYVTLSNECRLYKKWEREGKSNSREFLQWFVQHEKDCTLNHDGSSKTMEAQGAVMLFQRSVEKHNLQYTTYVGDGDSSAYGSVVDSTPSGPDVVIAKEDCVGHIQGRMGKHLRRLVDQYKGRKLEDGKQLTGKERLTNKLMNSFQTFYGMAIRNNKGDATVMKKNVMAILYHYGSTFEKPMHQYCPQGDSSWCKWQVDIAKGTSTYRPLKNPLSEVVMDVLKPVFHKLSDERLLSGAEKCLTQNQNESLHHVIWTYLPKGEYHSPGEIEFGTALAVGHFNSGMKIFNGNLFEKANINIGENNIKLWENIDNTRIRHAEYKSSEKGKTRRKERKAQMAQYQDSLQYDDSYAKDKYYKHDQPSSVQTKKGKQAPKCKKCGKPMKGHKKQMCIQAS